MRYAKGHGTGNDFIIVPDLDDQLDLGAELVRRLCDRHTGLGADGVLRVVSAAASASGGRHAAGPETDGRKAGGAATGGPTTGGQDVGVPQWFMDYRNADGSIAEMCGNGVRVFARYLIDQRLATGPELVIGTESGVRLVRQLDAETFCVDMGPAVTRGSGWARADGRRFGGLVVWVGNPHLACLVTEPVEELDLSEPPELDPVQFPGGGNLELLRVTGDRAIEMRVHERGSGETLSCGTGAVAAAVAAATAAGEWPGNPAGPWSVSVPGGKLTVTVSATASLLTGPAVIVAEGVVAESWLADSKAPVSATA